jgi:hypothetical protein
MDMHNPYTNPSHPMSPLNPNSPTHPFGITNPVSLNPISPFYIFRNHTATTQPTTQGQVDGKFAGGFCIFLVLLAVVMICYTFTRRFNA